MKRLLSFLKRLASFVAPEGLLLLGTATLLHMPAWRRGVADFAQFYPPAVFVVGVLLGWRFQRSRLVFAMLVLALAWWGICLPHPGGESAAGWQVVFQATALLLPLNLAALAIARDRGLLTPFGVTRLVIIGAQVLLVDLCRRTAALSTLYTLTDPILPAQLTEWTALGQQALLAFAVALAPTIFFAPATAGGRGFVWAIVAAFLAVNVPELGHPTTALYLGTAGLILVVAVIETSYLLAYQDGLTGLPARRALTEALQRLAGQYTVAMVDVDHFKKFNDQYGHDVGDQVLRMVAAKLGQVEGGGRAYRYGGEEFAIVFPGRELEETVPPLEAVRKAIAETRFTIRRRIRPRNRPATPRKGSRARTEISITVSIGVATKTARLATPDQVIRAADQALYTAKEAGRNRLSV